MNSWLNSSFSHVLSPTETSLLTLLCRPASEARIEISQLKDRVKMPIAHSSLDVVRHGTRLLCSPCHCWGPGENEKMRQGRHKKNGTPCNAGHTPMETRTVHCMFSLARNTLGTNGENLRLGTFQRFKLCHLPKKALSMNHPHACFMICRNTISEHLVLERR